MNLPPNDRMVFLYDTTLRDGSQQRGISFSVEEKLKTVQELDKFGIPYIECGWPGSNPKDCEFFQRAKQLELEQARLAAFGSTRRANSKVEEDKNLLALLDAETPVVTLVGKSSILHVERIIETSREENLAMIEESVAYMKRHEKEVVFDAEHFFDGFTLDDSYALETLAAAAAGGADSLVLCDTNGGSTPEAVYRTVVAVKEFIEKDFPSVIIGIHTHNDAELAVANSLAAVEAGCRHVQGTINGYGERCGNANLVSIIPNLQLKYGYTLLESNKLDELTKVSKLIAELANCNQNVQAAYVGLSAFAHKGGLHVAAVEKLSSSYEHIEPSLVGNKREILISELSGRGNVRALAADAGIASDGNESRVLEEVKRLEGEGYQFEQAEGSVELIIRRSKDDYQPSFSVNAMMVVSEFRDSDSMKVQAIVKVDINGQEMHTAAEGVGPVDALDQALRKALLPHYPQIEQVRLSDYKVRIVDPKSATSAKTRVFLQARDGVSTWSTIGCSSNIIEASVEALTDSYQLFLSRAETPNIAEKEIVGL
jgi:2-isopropylmalate synthase